MRIWIAAFLLLLFASQALPVAAFSKSYGKSQTSVTKDVCEDEDGKSMPKGGKVKKQNSLSEEDYDHRHSDGAPAFSLQTARKKRLHHSDHLMVVYSGEVATPPPNCC